MSSSVATPQFSSERRRTAVTMALLRRLRKVARDLDATVPICDPLLWATHCSLDAAILLLHAYVRSATNGGQDREAVLEAIGAGRATVLAATFACRDYRCPPDGLVGRWKGDLPMSDMTASRHLRRS